MGCVQFSPFTSIFENKSSGTVIVGSPGSGKTFFILNLCANALIMKQKIFAIDPKNDLGIISELFPEVEYIDINDIEPGALNPFEVIDNIDTNVLTSIISIICGGLNDSQLVSITPIINDFINQNRRFKTNSISFDDVASYLYANDDPNAQAIGTKLQIHKDSKYGKLLFEHSKKTINFNNSSKIISFHGMDLPKENNQNLTEEQKFNSGIVYIICKMLRQLLITDKYPTLFIMDEAHIAFRNESFSSIIDEFLVLGRSLNIATILATQNASHFPVSISQLIASKFCFRSSTSESKQFLEMFFNKDSENMADFPNIINKIGQFESGENFFIDSENRTGFFKVTSLLGDISSNPLTRRKNNKNDEIKDKK